MKTMPILFSAAALITATPVLAQTSPAPSDPAANAIAAPVDTGTDQKASADKAGKKHHHHHDRATTTEQTMDAPPGGGMIDANGMPVGGSGIPAATTGGNGAPPR